MKLKFKNVLRFLIITIILSGFYVSGAAQMIDRTNGYATGTIFNGSCPGVGCEITLPPLKLEEQRIFDIPLLVPGPDNVTITNITATCSEILNNYTLTNVANQITVKVDEKCSSGNSTLSFIVNVTKSGEVPDNQQYHIPIIRDRAKIALVLDISGSMSLNVLGTTETRIDELKGAVNLLMPKLELFKGSNDSLAMTYFSSNVIQPEATYFPNDFVWIDDTDADFNNWSSARVYYDLDVRTPLQMTALGDGLRDAKNKLDKDNGSDVRRMVFLFTDGLQNWGNQLMADGLTFQTGTDSLNNLQTNPKDSIYYYPVATWAAGDQPELFQNIVDANKGEVLFVTPSSNLLSWFNNQLVNMLDHGSPQIVMEKFANNISESIDYDFNLNDNISTMAIELATKGEIGMQIFKDGIDITSKARARTGDNFNLVSFEFPIVGDPVINSGGEWIIKLTGGDEAELPYSLAVLADDHFSNFECAVDKSRYTVGDIINFKTKLEYNGTALSESGNSVKAILLKPGDDLGHLLSTYETPDNQDTIIDNDSELANKFNELLANDSSFYNALLPEEQIINLTDNGNGEFEGTFANTELAGIYNVVYLINANIPNQGKLVRTKSLSTIFVFGQVVEEEPEEIDNAPAPSSGSQFKHMVFKIRPKNKFGYYMGPGFKSKIRVKIKNKISVKPQKTSKTNVENNIRDPFLEEIRDNLDGSYYLYIANLDDPTKWDVAIEVRDEVLYDYASSMPIWFYILALILLILALVFKKAGKTKVLFWILFIIWLIIIILKYIGYINFL